MGLKRLLIRFAFGFFPPNAVEREKFLGGLKLNPVLFIVSGTFKMHYCVRDFGLGDSSTLYEFLDLGN